MEPTPEIIAYYERFAEETRLATGPGRLEFERTKDILGRLLPPPPARLIDIGGAAGVYSAWLSERGYDMHLVDASPRLVEEARRHNRNLTRPIASLTVADARSLPQPDGFADAALLMGPLYHLQTDSDRALALTEAARVLRPAALLIAAAISRYASALDGLVRQRSEDPAFVRMRNRDLRDGHHLNESGHPGTSRPRIFTSPKISGASSRTGVSVTSTFWASRGRDGCWEISRGGGRIRRPAGTSWMSRGRWKLHRP